MRIFGLKVLEAFLPLLCIAKLWLETCSWLCFAPFLASLERQRYWRWNELGTEHCKNNPLYSSGIQLDKSQTWRYYLSRCRLHVVRSFGKIRVRRSPGSWCIYGRTGQGFIGSLDGSWSLGSLILIRIIPKKCTLRVTWTVACGNSNDSVKN